MEVLAKSKYIRQSPRKLRLVANEVRGLPVGEAVARLMHLNKKGARPILLTIKQGVGNAVNNFQLREESLIIKKIEVNKGPSFKRMDKSHRVFRWGTVEKKTAHLSLVLEGKKQAAKQKPKAEKKEEKKIQGKRKLSLKRKRSESAKSDRSAKKK